MDAAIYTSLLTIKLVSAQNPVFKRSENKLFEKLEKNVAKTSDFYVIKKPKKRKSCLNRGVAKIEGFQNRGSTVQL